MASHGSMSNAYDAFLFESLGTEANGMDLSVLSALAIWRASPGKVRAVAGKIRAA